jgi:hypothetical protein
MLIHVNKPSSFFFSQFALFSIGWFGLRRDLCEIILGHCPFISLYFNNRFKFPSRTSTNNLILDLTTEKTFEPLNLNTLTSTDMNEEKNLARQYHFLSLLEPD